MRWLARALLAVAALTAFAFCTSAHAHLTPNSEVQIDFGQHELRADIIIPQGEYRFVTGNPTDNNAPSYAQAEAFLRRHISFNGRDGRAWPMAFGTIEFVQIAGPPDLHAIVSVRPPPDVSARKLTITWNAVIDRIPSHFVLFVARSDFAAGKLDEHRQILGALQQERRTLAIDRGLPATSSGFTAAIRLDMRHIAEGHDHLLFLIALLLPAPLLAASGRWNGTRGTRSTIGHLAGIVSAFTAGHSVTLIGAAAFDWHLPARPVETLIAFSILISAVHGLRPLFPGREAWVAALFGLIHGLAFAKVVSNFGLDAAERALSILGFNLGIEIVQLAFVFSFVPSLLLLAKTDQYRIFRMGGEIAAIVASIGWMAERLGDIQMKSVEVLDAAFGYAPYLIIILTAWGLAAQFQRARKTDWTH